MLEIPKDYVAAAESTHAIYQVDVEAFAGPLDLLLFLIRRHQINIFDIPIAFVCKQYLACMQAMEDLSIDVASEFLFMAAELMHIKSRMLLPRPQVEEEEEEADPRAELVRRLLEYQKYQAAAADMDGLSRLGRDVFVRPPEPLPPRTLPKSDDGPEAEPQDLPPGLALVPENWRETSIFALVQAFDVILKRQKPEVRHQVVMEQVSVRKRMMVLAQSLSTDAPVAFAGLVEGLFDRLDIIVTFLAILEMTRLKLVRLYESDTGSLYLHARFDDTELAMDRISGIEEQFAG